MNLPPQPSPRLPPEVLYPILEHFHKLCLLDPDALLDLVAISMVCREWYIVARPLILDKCLHKPFAFVIPVQYANRLKRLAALLFTAHQLGLPYSDTIKCFDVPVDNFVPEFLDRQSKSTSTYDHQDREALFTILSFTTLMHLKLIVKNPSGTPPRLHNRALLFSRLTHHCARIPNLELHFPDSWRFNHSPPSPSDPHLPSFMHAVKPSLTTISINNEPDPATRDALSLLSHACTASFRLCSARSAHCILRGQYTLRAVELRCVIGPGTANLLVGLAVACTQLEDLTVVETPYSYQTSWAGRESEAWEPLERTLEKLIYRCWRLRRLCLVGLRYAGEGILFATALRCRLLERLEWEQNHSVTGSVTGADVWDELTTPWPLLRSMCVMSQMLGPSFLEPVVTGCEALEEVEFPTTVLDWDVDGRLKEALERRGFWRKYGYGPRWCRGEGR